MALGPTRPLFDQRWQDKLSVAPERAMTGTIQIFDPNTSQAVYVAATGTYTSVPTVLYEGKARVQPRRFANISNNTVERDVLVSIPIAEGKNLVVRPHYRAKILASPLNPSLTAYLYVVKDALDSTNPIERTLVFRVNEETAVV